MGVSTKTIRRWVSVGRIKFTRTEGGHRRFLVSDLLGSRQDASLTVAYAPSQQQRPKRGFESATNSLRSDFAPNKAGMSEIISDLGSGMNYRKKGLIRLIKLICSHQVERLVLTHKDRLLRFGSDLIFTLCEIFGTEVVIINRTEDSTYEENLAQDVLEIITVFSARLYASRSHKNKQIIKELKQVADQIK